MIKNVAKKAISIFLSIVLATSCAWLSPKSGEIGRVVVMYLTISSNLQSSMSMNVADVKNSPYLPQYFEVGRSGDVLLVLEHYESSYPKLKRLFIDKFGVPQEEVLEEYPGRTSTDPDLLHEVLTYVNSIFPAKEKGLLFSSHGTGWLPEGYYRNPNAFGGSTAQFEEEPDPYAHLVKSFGQIGDSEMDIIKLAEALPIEYSYIIFDACLMGGIEVAYELKDKSKYQILSPTEIMAAGFPYDAVMKSAFEKDVPLKQRLRSLTRSYYDYYSSKQNQGGTIVMIESEELEDVASSAKVIYTKCRKNIENIDVSTLQPYFRFSSRHWFYDLGDVMESMGADASDLNSFKLALDGAIVEKYHTASFLNIDIKSYSGLSTYLQKPKNPFLDSYYKGFSWNRDVSAIR